MKRFSSGDNTGKWKRIIGPVDDSDSSSSSSLDELYERHLQDFHPCARCKRSLFVCKCSRLDALPLPRAQTPQFGRTMSLDREQPQHDPDQAGSSGISAHQLSHLGDHVGEASEGPVAVSFRATTNIQPFEKRKRIFNYITNRRIYIGNEQPLNLLKNVTGSSSFVFQRREAAENNNDTPQQVGVEHVATPTVSPVEPGEPALSAVPANEESSAIMELELLHAKLIGLLECPVCLEPIAPPIHQCLRGHLVCSRCKTQLSQCPTCRDQMSDARNWAIERIAEQLRYPCKNSTSGCPQKMLLSQKEEHESACSFRTFVCPFRTCSWAGFRPELLPHLRQAHANRFLEGDLQYIDVELNSPTSFYTDWAVSCLDEVFRLNVFQHIPNSILFVSCYYLGPANRAANFTYTISMSGSQNRRLMYTRQTHSESTKMSNVCATSDCFLIKGDVIKYFVDEGRLKLRVQFERVSSQ